MASRRSPSFATVQAAEMRRFDPGLTDEQVATIARKIEEQREMGASLARKPLPNAVEPLVAPLHERPA